MEKRRKYEKETKEGRRRRWRGEGEGEGIIRIKNSLEEGTEY